MNSCSGISLTATAGTGTQGARVNLVGTSLNGATLDGASVTLFSELRPKSLTLLNGATYTSSPCTSLDALNDTTISGPVVNQFLYHNGTKWTNGTLSGKITPTVSGATNCTVTGIQPLYYSQQGSTIQCFCVVVVTVTAMAVSFSFNVSLPVALPGTNFASAYQASGSANANTITQTGTWNGFVRSNSTANTIGVGMRVASANVSAITGFEVYTQFAYNLVA